MRVPTSTAPSAGANIASVVLTKKIFEQRKVFIAAFGLGYKSHGVEGVPASDAFGF